MKDAVHQDFNEKDFKEHFCQEIQELEKQPTIKSNVENSDTGLERSVQSKENQNSQQESNLFNSESSSIQNPVRKKMPVRQGRVDIEYSIHEKGTLEDNSLEKGILFGCKMCHPPRIFPSFRALYYHFRYYDGPFNNDAKTVSDHFKKHDQSFVVSMCKKCKNESIHPDFLDLNEGYFREHNCQEIRKSGSEIVESVNLNNENQNSQQDFATVRNKRSSEASENETLVMKAKKSSQNEEISISVINEENRENHEIEAKKSSQNEEISIGVINDENHEIQSTEASNKTSNANEDLSFNSEKSLAENLTEKSEELKCHYCDKIQPNKSSLTFHISTVHLLQNPFLNENIDPSVEKKQIENNDEVITIDDKIDSIEKSNEGSILEGEIVDHSEPVLKLHKIKEIAFDTNNFSYICTQLEKLPVIFKCKNESCMAYQILQNFDYHQDYLLKIGQVKSYFEEHDCTLLVLIAFCLV